MRPISPKRKGVSSSLKPERLNETPDTSNDSNANTIIIAIGIAIKILSSTRLR
jgi:hypothetical protein